MKSICIQMSLDSSYVNPFFVPLNFGVLLFDQRKWRRTLSNRWLLHSDRSPSYAFLLDDAPSHVQTTFCFWPIPYSPNTFCVAFWIQFASVDSIGMLSSRSEKKVLWWNALRKTTWRWTAGLITLQASVQMANDWRREMIFFRTDFTSFIISSFQYMNVLLVPMNGLSRCSNTALASSSSCSSCSSCSILLLSQVNGSPETTRARTFL